VSETYVTPSAKKPIATKWTEIDRLDKNAMRGAVYERKGIRVVSTLDYAKLPQSEDTGPQWHISVSNSGRFRPTQDEVNRALRDFEMVGAEIDNHHPGVAQHFWMPVDPKHRVDCECKDDEIVVIEPDGYTWSNDPNECRGCEIAKKIPGRKCTVHS
jgi:hypothetical protein